MSNSSELGTRSEAASPSGDQAPAQGPPRVWGWFLAKVDSLLSEALRQAPPLECNRARLLASLAALNVVLTLVFLIFLVPRTERPGLLGFVAVLCIAGYSSSLAMLRRVSSPRLPALVMCSCLVVGMVAVTLEMGVLALAVQAPAVMIPMVSVYLLGIRKSLFLSLLLAVNAGIIHPLLYARPGSLDWVAGTFTATILLCVCLVSWLFTLSRDEADAELERAHKTLSVQERKLSSLLENTEDVVCSLDPQGRIVTANLALRQLFLLLLAREIQPGDALGDLLPMEDPARWRERFQQVLGGERVRVEVHLTVRDEARVLDVSLGPILGEAGQPEGMTLFGKDITARKQAEARLGEMHRNLLDVSRQAGMAEVATGVLHNVGNTLNSANVSAELVSVGLRGLRVASVVKTSKLLREHAGDLGSFLASAQGRQLPAYLEALGEELSTGQARLVAEMRALSESLEHVKTVVNMQQEHARALGVVERVEVPQLIDDAMRLQTSSYEAMGIQLRREYGPVPPILVDRHKLLQILLNLLSNARQALMESSSPDKVLTVRVSAPAEDRLRIDVEDTGSGIAPENLPRLFSQGFTTKRTGHGFGLHISSLSATELGGSLSCTSRGLGQGATFTLELPREARKP